MVPLWCDLGCRFRTVVVIKAAAKPAFTSFIHPASPTGAFSRVRVYKSEARSLEYKLELSEISVRILEARHYAQIFHSRTGSGRPRRPAQMPRRPRRAGHTLGRRRPVSPLSEAPHGCDSDTTACGPPRQGGRPRRVRPGADIMPSDRRRRDVPIWII